MKIFWSWQSDHDRKTGQYFVRDALKEVAKQLGQELELTEAERLEVDHDTQGVPGTPPIVETILNKIEEATIFVADVTPVGTSAKGKLLPNPNVMIELGYARRARGHQRIILVANAQHLTKPEDLPFDLRGDRGPTIYKAVGQDGPTLKGERKVLVATLKPKIAEIISFDQMEHARVALSRLGVDADKRTKWFEDDEILTYVDAFSRHAKGAVQLPRGPHSFMRITPAQWPGNVRTSNLSPRGNRQTLAIGRGSNGDWGQTKDGMLSYWFSGRQHDGVTHAHVLTQWFSENGVVWSVWSDIVSDNTPRWFYGDQIMKWWGRFLKTAVRELVAIGAKGPFRVDAGVVGIAGARWNLPMSDGALFAAPDEVRRSSTEVTADVFTQERFLASLFNRLTDAFGFVDEITVEQVRTIIES